MRTTSAKCTPSSLTPRVDLLHPENDIMFKMKHMKARLKDCGCFFDLLTNLNKLVAYEQRDPFIQKNELDNTPGYTDWDRYAQQEYMRLAMEEENGGEVSFTILTSRTKSSTVLRAGSRIRSSRRTTTGTSSGAAGPRRIRVYNRTITGIVEWDEKKLTIVGVWCVYSCMEAYRFTFRI